jgi:hypothetical protein
MAKHRVPYANLVNIRILVVSLRVKTALQDLKTYLAVVVISKDPVRHVQRAIILVQGGLAVNPVLEVNMPIKRVLVLANPVVHYGDRSTHFLILSM